MGHPEADIQDAETILRGAERIAGAAKLADGLVLIHDLDTFLSQAESMALDAALDAALDDGDLVRGEAGGLTLTEYGIILAFLVLALLVAVALVRQSIEALT